MPLSADQKAMLELLLERGQSYDDLAQVLGVAPEEVRARARAALTELASADPDRNVALTDYLLGQADPIDRADAVRHLKGDPEDLAMATELAQKLRLVAPEAQLPRLPGSERRPRPRRTAREVPAPLRKVLPARRGGEPRERRTTLTRRQTQAIVVAGCAAVLIAVGALAAAGVFTDSSGSATSATSATSTTSASNLAGRPQGYPLGIVRPSASGSFQNTIPIPQAVQSILPQVQAVTITLAENRGVAKAIQTAIKQRQPLQVQGRPEFLGVVGTRQGKVFPIQLRAGKGVKGSGDAALGIANKQPFFQIRLHGLKQPPKGESYIIWLVLGTGQGG